MRAMVVSAFGGPEALRRESVPDPSPSAGEVVVEHESIGVNFVDTQHRAGAPYPVELPLVPGIEAAGVVAAVGPNVEGVEVGDRVAYGGIMPGVYAEFAAVPADQLVALDDGTTAEVAAATLLHGWTALMLADCVERARTTSIGPSSGSDAAPTAVVFAAAGGTGSLLVQVLVAHGWRVLGVCSGDEKAVHVRSLGAEPVDRRAGDVVAEVQERTGGGHAVVEGIGGAVFDQARPVLRPGGHLVSFGQTAGPVPAIDPAILSGISPAGGPGSLTLTWPTLNDHNATPEARRQRARDVFGRVDRGELTVRIDRVDALTDAADAHAALESGDTVGKLLLDPTR